MSAPHWSAERLARVDKDNDRERASNGWSRYAAYIDMEQEWFAEEVRGRKVPLSPERFALAAWRTATSPVMAPGYVETRPDLLSFTLGLADDHRHVEVSAMVPLPHRALEERPPLTWRGWTLWEMYAEGGYSAHEPPEPLPGWPALTVSARISVSGKEWTLPLPTATGGRELAEQAMNACDALVSHINADLGPLVARLKEGTA